MTSKTSKIRLRRVRKALLGGCGAAAILGPIAVAFGQEPETPTAASVEEITVTAQRRIERLQDVPISAQVMSGQVLIQQNLTSLNAMNQFVPSVHVSSAGRSTDIYMRGTGSGQNPSFDQSVGIFIDDIYHGRSRVTNATFLDLERLEILKGPQSTFFGNNAIAGAFNIATQKPGAAFDAWMRALFSPDSGTNGGQYALEGAAGGPITETFGIRVAATYNGQEGWLENVSTGNRVPKEDNKAARMTLSFTPDEVFDATLKIEGSENSNEGGLALQVDSCPPSAPFVASGFCSTILSSGFPADLDSNQYGANDGAEITLDTHEFVLTANYRAGEHTLTSVSGYYGYDFNSNVDSDGTSLFLVHAQVPEEYSQFSQEFRIASPTHQRIAYLAGIYYQTDDLQADTLQGLGFLSPALSAGPLGPFLPLGQAINFSQDEKSYAVFGSLTWNATDRLALTAGLRGTWVDKDFDWTLFYATATQDYGGLLPLPSSVALLPAALGLGTPTTLSGSRSDDAWMPSARIQYEISPQAMAYLSYARGFKAGGFNGTDVTGVAANLPFDPESVDAYEIGVKSEWLDDRLLLNLALFRSDYTDLQVAINQLSSAGTFISQVRNAAASVAQGAELEGQWVATDHFRLAANVSYIDSYYGSYPNATLTNLQQLLLNQCGTANAVNPAACDALRVQDLSGRPTQFAPTWSGSVTGTYVTPVFNDFQLTAELTGIFSSEFYILPTIDPLGLQSGYGRLDARLSLRSPDRRWAFDVVGKNMNDKTIATFTGNLPRSLGSLLQQKAQPRSIAFQVRYHW